MNNLVIRNILIFYNMEHSVRTIYLALVDENAMDPPPRMKE